MSGFADAALDVFVCPTVFAHYTAQVGELAHFLDLFLLQSHWVLPFVLMSRISVFPVLILRPVFSASAATKPKIAFVKDQLNLKSKVTPAANAHLMESLLLDKWLKDNHYSYHPTSGLMQILKGYGSNCSLVYTP